MLSYSGDQVDAGAYTVTATYAGDANHTGSSDTASITIAKANATITVTPYSVTYDANPHTATGTAKGVGGVALSGLSLSGTMHTNAGTYAGDSWNFTDLTGNYNNASGTVSDSIAKATPVITWPTPANITYDTALTSTQLDATASVPGTFIYAPAAGTVLNPGYGQTLSVTFTPTDTTDYTTATASVTINVTTVITVTPGSIYVLDPTAGGALSLSGNSAINTPGSVVVDSNSNTAILATGNAAVTATGGILVMGSVSNSGNANVKPTGKPGATGDPLAALAAPATSGLTNYGAVSLSGNNSQTLNPGIYTKIAASGNAKLALNPGTYLIEGGGLTVTGNASIVSSGSGVLIFNAGSNYPNNGGAYGSIALSGNGTVELNAAVSGTYAGVVIFQSRDNPQAVSLAGNALEGVIGTIYAPKAQLAISGNGQLKDTLVVDMLSLSGNAVAQLVASSGGTVYTPAQIRTAYGVNNLSLDGAGQTIAIVEAYDNPLIYQAVDAFDGQFGLSSSGPTLSEQYGPATSFLTVLNQDGQPTCLPGTDPAGQGSDNWEVESALDAQSAHAMAPAARIIVVEANSQSLSDLMVAAATAARQPGVSAVSMSWGFAEGQDVLGADEAAYDGTFTTPGVTFVASTGDYGAADPVYPAFSPNVLAVGGTCLSLNADNSYHSELGWGYFSNSLGTFIASGGGLSRYESEPAYQQRVQSTGSRTTPDVSFVADPATGAWIADPYNLDPSDPWEVVGGTSLSAPCWAGLIALVNQGRAATGQPPLNSANPTETQQSVYSLSQSDYHVITSGSNGYSAVAGYNLVTGLGTPVADHLVPDLVAGNFPSTGQVPPASTVALVNAGTTGLNSSGPASVMNVFNVFTALTMTSSVDSSPTEESLWRPLQPTSHHHQHARRPGGIWAHVQ